MLVSRSVTSDDGVFIPCSSNFFFLPIRRLFFKVLSSWSFLKSRRLWVRRSHITISFMGTLILVSVHNSHSHSSLALFVRWSWALSGGVSTGMGETFWDTTCNILWLQVYFLKESSFIVFSLFFHCFSKRKQFHCSISMFLESEEIAKDFL